MMNEYLFGELIEGFLDEPIDAEDLDGQLGRLMIALDDEFDLYQNDGERLPSQTYAVLIKAIDQYRREKNNIYRISERFGKHLYATKTKLKGRALQKTDDATYVIQLPFDFMMAKYSMRHLVVHVDMEYDRATICGSVNRLNGEPDGFVNTIISIPKDDEICLDVKDVVYSTVDKAPEIKAHETTDIFNYVLKCIAYINSNTPDLELVASPVCTKKNPAKRRRFFKQNPPFNIQNVGYSFHNRTYHVDEAQVIGHFRWQPCGPGKQQVRLIWIDEHKRKYSKESA